LAMLPTLDESGVRFARSAVETPTVGGPQPAGAAPSANPAATPSPLDKGKGVASSTSAPGDSRGSEEERRCRLRRADGSLVSEPPKSTRGLQAEPRRPALGPTVHRGASVLRSLHYHRHLGVITARGTGSSNSSRNSSSSSGGRLASRVAGRSRAPSMCSPFFFEPKHHADRS
jgi:hypothetical protein